MPREIKKADYEKSVYPAASRLLDALDDAGVVSVEVKQTLAELQASTTGIRLTAQGLVNMIVGERLAKIYALDPGTVSRLLQKIKS